VCENALKAVPEVCAIDSAAFENQAHGHGRENEKSLFYFACDFSGWYNFEKIIKTVACHQMSYFKGKMRRIRFRLERFRLG